VIVIDASAMLEFLLSAPASAAIGNRISAAGEALHAPCLIDVEVVQTLRRFGMAKSLGPAHSRRAFEEYLDMRVERHPHDVLLPRIWELRHNLTAYDAAYVALAEALDAPLVTCDRAIGSAKGHRANVLLF
jgi:predicted nucleic acid-binding protein